MVLNPKFDSQSFQGPKKFQHYKQKHKLQFSFFDNNANIRNYFSILDVVSGLHLMAQS